MKFTAKRAGRLLAAVLAILMVFSTVSVCFSALAADGVYTVEYTSPAIPMTAGTMISLENLEFETSSGVIISGDNAVISLVNDADADDVVIDGAFIHAKKKGTYEAVVTDGTDSVSVYIVVKATNEKQWTLYSADFNSAEWNDSTKALPEDWVYQIGGTKIGVNTIIEEKNAVPYSSVEGIPQDANGILVTGNAPAVDEAGKIADDTTSVFFTLNDSAVNAFRDYTVSANMLVYTDFVTTSLSTRNGSAAVGFFVRATGADEDGKFTVGSSSSFNTDVFAVNVNPDSDLGGYAGYAKFSKFIKATSATTQSNIFKWTNVNKCNVTTGLTAAADIELSLKLDGTTATLSEAAGDSSTYENITLPDRTGNVGIYVGYADGNYAVVQNFNVYLNNSYGECPPYSNIGDDGIERYEVDLERAPAIPMNANTFVSLNHLSFNIGGVDYFGNEVSVVSDNNEVTVTDGAIYAYETGVYPVTLTIEDFTATAYVVVKDIDDDKWYLVNEKYKTDYTGINICEENEHPNNWVVNYAVPSFGDTGWQEIKYSPTCQTTANYAQSGTSFNGWLPFMDPYKAGYAQATNDNAHVARGYATYSDGVVENFADYTIYYGGKAYNHWSDNIDSGIGLFGRGAVDANGMLDRNTNSTNGLVAFSVNNEDSQAAVITQTLTSNKPAWTNSNALTNSMGTTWANWTTSSNVSGSGQNLGVYTEYALKYDGDTATFWNPKKESSGVYTATVPVSTGAVGVFACRFGSTGYLDGNNYPTTWCTVDTFAVVLNNAADELPYAQEIEPLEALGATIRPETSANSAGLRFGIRAYSLHLSDDVILSDETVTVDGFEYPITGYGTIMLPEVLLGGNDLVHGIDLDIKETAATEYSAANENFAEFIMTLIGIPENYKTLDIACRAYVAYNAGGITKYVYADTVVRSFYGTQAAISGIYPLNVINPDFDAEDFSTFDITYDSMTNQGVWETPESAFDEEAEALKEEIYSYSDTLKSSYYKLYVDPDASSNGSGTESSPYNNLSSAISKASSYSYRSYKILIKRGTIIRGNFTLPARASLGAYGDASLPKPAIFGSDKNYADLTWSETSTANVYSVACEQSNIGNIVFNYGQAIGRDRTSVVGLKNNFDYYADGTNLYVYSDVGNPGDICQSIELSFKDGRAVLVINSNCTVENIQVMFGGAHGIQANDTTGAKIQGTVVGFIGGSSSSYAKYGNGIEFWNGTTSATVDSCYVYQCYDAAVTHQFTDQGADTTASFKNITYSNNLIEYNFMGIEYFNTTSSTSDSMTGISVTGNIIRFSGYGFGEYTRPDLGAACAIRGIGTSDNAASKFTFTNNILDHSRNYTAYYGAAAESSLPTFSGNTYGIREDYAFWRIQNVDSTTGRQRTYRSDWGYYDEGNYQIDDVFAFTGDTTASVVYYGLAELGRTLTGNEPVANERTLNNTVYKITNEKELNVVYLGGSVTQGHGATNQNLANGTSWAAKVHQYLTAKYPNATINGHNAGIGGTGSFFGNHRLDRDVFPQDPDLVFIDFAINDYYEGYTEEQSTVYMESLINNIQAEYPDADIVMILVTDENNAGKDYTNLTAHETVANHYGIPVVNVGEVLGEKISAGASWSDYSGDSVHPNDAGYKIYADAIIEKISKLLPDIPAKLEAHKLPEQYITHLMEDSYMITADQIGAQTGWTLRTTSSDSATNSLRGYAKLSTALIPASSGAKLTYNFTGSAFGMIVEPGTNQKVTVTIDGVASTTMVENGSEEKIIKVIFDNLRDGEHTVEITYGGTGEFAVGAFLIG